MKHGRAYSGLVASAMTIVICIGLLVPGIGAKAAGTKADDEETYDGFTYRIEDEGAVITGYSGTETDVVVPEELGGEEVVEIGQEAFRGSTSIVSIELPDTLEMIGEGAFEDCLKLRQVVIGGGVIGESAFRNCPSLSELDLGETEEIGESAFRDDISLPVLKLPDTLTEIGSSAFQGCISLAEAEIPEGVTRLGKDVFSECIGLLTARIPGGIRKWEGGRKGNGLFKNDTSLQYVSVADGTRALGAGLFTGCSSLRGIEIPESVSKGLANSLEDCPASATVYCAGPKVRKAAEKKGLTCVDDKAMPWLGDDEVTLEISILGLPEDELEDAASITGRITRPAGSKQCIVLTAGMSDDKAHPKVTASDEYDGWQFLPGTMRTDSKAAAADRWPKAVPDMILVWMDEDAGIEVEYDRAPVTAAADDKDAAVGEADTAASGKAEEKQARTGKKAVEFTDKALEQLVCQALGLTPEELTPSALADVTELYIIGDASTCRREDVQTLVETYRQGEVRHLADLKNLPGLKVLDVWGNSLSSLTKEDVAAIRWVEELNLDNNDLGFGAIELIGTLYELKSLSLIGNHIVDLDGMERLDKLESFFAGNNAIEDISALGSIQGLKRLSLPYNKVTDLGALQGLHELRELNLDNNSFSSLEPLRGHFRMESLSFNNNSVSDISVLSTLTGLRTLEMTNNRVRDLRPVLALTSINRIMVSGNPADYSVLTYFTPEERDY